MTQTPNHSDRGHAEFSPSALKYSAGCAGYQGRDGTSAAAEMGTRIHEAIEILDPSNLQSEQEVSIYNEIVSDQDEYLKNYKHNRRVTEEQAEIQLDVALNGTSTYGTCDYLVIFDNVDACLIDYKTGNINESDLSFTLWEELRLKTKKSALFQVLLYAYILKNEFKQKDVIAGVIPLKTFKNSFLAVTQKENIRNKNIINKKIDYDLYPDLLEQLGIDKPLGSKKLYVRYGGPVESGRGFVLHSDEVIQKETLSIDSEPVLLLIRNVWLTVQPLKSVTVKS